MGHADHALPAAVAAEKCVVALLSESGHELGARQKDAAQSGFSKADEPQRNWQSSNDRVDTGEQSHVPKLGPEEECADSLQWSAICETVASECA